MKTYTVHLTREYVVEINAHDEDTARHYVEFYVSGGEDTSLEATRLSENFQIVRIKPTVNEGMILEDK